MKLIRTTFLGLFILAAVPSMSYATLPKDAFFVGFDVQHNMFNEKVAGIHDNLNGASIKGGYRWNKIGVEAGATFLQKVNYTELQRVTFFQDRAITVLEQKNYNLYLDAQIFIPLNNAFEIKATAGIGRLSTNFSSAFTDAKSDHNAIKPRVGAGLQYAFNKDLTADLMYRYQGGNSIYKNMQTISLGLNLYFG